jgi:hypothetical protein
MITVRQLKKLIENLPDNALVFGYEGEDTGLTVELSDHDYGFIHACEETHCEKCRNSALR